MAPAASTAAVLERRDVIEQIRQSRALAELEFHYPAGDVREGRLGREHPTIVPSGAAETPESPHFCIEMSQTTAKL